MMWTFLREGATVIPGATSIPDSRVHFKKEKFLVPPVKVYKKVVKFSFTQQKIFGVLVFSFMYLVLVDPMGRSNV